MDQPMDPRPLLNSDLYILRDVVDLEDILIQVMIHRLRNRFHSTGDHSPGIYDLNRKRKLLQYELENSGLPWPKHKVRDRSCTFDHEPLIPESLDEENSPEEIIDRGIGDGLEVESDNDSNSFTGGSDNKMMTLDANGDTEGLSTKSFLQDQPSTPSNISASGCLHDVNNGLCAGLEHTQHPGYRSTEDQCAGFGSTTGGLKQHGNDDVELDDETTEDIMLCSNDVAVASGRWSSGQDARMGTRKPTIDQEFEQHFSALIL